MDHRRVLLLGCVLLVTLSCTRMPTAPRHEVAVEGTILGPDGAAIRYADVLFYPKDRTLPDTGDPKWAHADINGHYTIQLTAGLYDLRIPPPRRGWIGYSNLVSISPENRIIDYAFHGVSVIGRLLDPEGGLVSGAVEATLEGPSPSTGYTYADAGAFSFLLPVGTYSFKLTSFRDQDALATTTLHSIPVSADTALDLQFVGIPVQGSVLGTTGEPLPQASVDAYPTITHTDSYGYYRLYTPPGVHTLRCWTPDPSVLPRLVTLAINTPITVNFDFRGNLYWTGQVVSAGNHTPLAGYYVVADVHGADNRDAWYQTGSTGFFQLYLEPNHAYDLYIFSSADWSRPPVYASVFKATADTTFELLVMPPVP